MLLRQKEYDAIQAAAQLKVVWNTNPILPGTGNLWKHYRDMDAQGKIPATVGSTLKGNVDVAFAASAHTVSGSFAHHYQVMQMTDCAIADVTATRVNDLEQHAERVQPQLGSRERVVSAVG